MGEDPRWSEIREFVKGKNPNCRMAPPIAHLLYVQREALFEKTRQQIADWPTTHERN